MKSKHRKVYIKLSKQLQESASAIAGPIFSPDCRFPPIPPLTMVSRNDRPPITRDALPVTLTASTLVSALESSDVNMSVVLISNNSSHVDISDSQPRLSDDDVMEPSHPAATVDNEEEKRLLIETPCYEDNCKVCVNEEKIEIAPVSEEQEGCKDDVIVERQIGQSGRMEESQEEVPAISPGVSSFTGVNDGKGESEELKIGNGVDESVRWNVRPDAIDKKDDYIAEPDADSQNMIGE